MTYSAPTPDELREVARSACEGQPESEMHKHPAWRAADLIEQEADHLLTGTGASQSPTGFMEFMKHKGPVLRSDSDLAIERGRALLSQGGDHSRHLTLNKDFKDCTGSLTKLQE